MLGDQRQAGDAGGTGAKAGPVAGTEAFALLYPDSWRTPATQAHCVPFAALGRPQGFLTIVTALAA